MLEKAAIVVTSILQPNQALWKLAQGSQQESIAFIVIGDEPSPREFQLTGCQFYHLDDQLKSGLKFAQRVPKRKYSRKNIGYLIAAQQGATTIIETDDDNIPYPSFWNTRERCQSTQILTETGWVNVYRYFSEAHIWPRGFPLDRVHDTVPPFESLVSQIVDCPIQQGLADDNPDVDAIYRLLLPLPQRFKEARTIALGSGSWCPFNSQNTTWWRDAYPLMYLPSYCSFRMTDIWRSFIAQAVAWINDWHILFHQPTVWQERNQHNLMQDFKQEIDGYLRNGELCEALQGLNLEPGVERIPDNLLKCYKKLVNLGFFSCEELNLLELWLTDLADCLS